MRRVSALTFAFAASVYASGAHAHHSYTEFDQARTIEIEGTLLVAQWQNPHTHLEVRDSSSPNTVWTIETSPINGIRRRGAPTDGFKVGQTVKVAGWPSKRASNRLYGTNMLGDGPELLLSSETPRWATSAGAPPSATATSTAGDSGGPTLFRVWSSAPQVDPDTRPGFLTRAQVSLTAAAQRAVDAFDPVAQSTTAGCTPKGMPILMGQPFPIEFVDEGDVILLRLEEYDAVRTIHMAPVPASAPEPSLLGYSVGRWDGGGVLVVETDRLDSPYFNSLGIPLSKAAITHERFTLSPDGRRLAYELTVTDPETFVEPARATRAWLARDGERVMPYDCKEAPRN